MINEIKTKTGIEYRYSLSDVEDPLFLTDFYKVLHFKMYPENTTKIYSNLTPRKSRIAGVDAVVVVGIQALLIKMREQWELGFFKRNADEVIGEYKDFVKYTLGIELDTQHLYDLHALGYLPLEIKALDEGTLCPIGVPLLTITNTVDHAYWLVNYLETYISAEIWQGITSATIAYEYRKILDSYAFETTGSNDGVDFQAHDFSMRGMSSVSSSAMSGLGHLLSFVGTDNIPAIRYAQKFYGANLEEVLVGTSVPATEHSVMCMGTKDDEIGTFARLLEDFPTGILSVVSDTWDLWKVCTEYLPALKEQIMRRGAPAFTDEYLFEADALLYAEHEETVRIGNKYYKIYHGPEHDSLEEVPSIFSKLVIRPDSGDPVDILCGVPVKGLIEEHGKFYIKGKYTSHKDMFGAEVWGSYEKGKEVTPEERKGVIELLWDVFGGTVNEHGYKVLDPHIGAIYGDSITLARCEEINARLKAKGFASTNWVAGVGSFSYQYNTRDTFGFAVKATYGEVLEPNGTSLENPVGREIFKDPITDDGTKKSKKGLLQVDYNWKSDMDQSQIIVRDQVTYAEEKEGLLRTVFLDGSLTNIQTLAQIREKLKRQ